jgi:hypothetical protein
VTLSDIVREAENLPESDRRQLLVHLVALALRDDSAYHFELHGRLAHDPPKSWIALEEAERRLREPSPPPA